VQEKETTNNQNFSDISYGRIIALDLGLKKVGVAVCDETQTAIRPLLRIERKSWKELLNKTKELVKELDAVALVLGLPLNMDETENEMTVEAKRLYRNYSLSLEIPVYLQDERLTSLYANKYLNLQKLPKKKILKEIDSEAAVLILNDFLSLKQQKYVD
jgi:putative holliday junction resolvase